MDFINQIKRERAISFNDSTSDHKKDDGNSDDYKVKIGDISNVEQFLDGNIECYEVKFVNNDKLNAESELVDCWESNCQPNKTEPASSTSTIEIDDEFFEIEHFYVGNNSKRSSSKRNLIRKTTKEHIRFRNKYFCTFCGSEVTDFTRHIYYFHSDKAQVKEILSLDKRTAKRRMLIDKLRLSGETLLTSDRESWPSETFKAKLNIFKPQLNIFKPQFAPDDPLRIGGLLEKLKSDNLSQTAKQDETICEVGRRYIVENQEHNILRIKKNMRHLAKLLISARSILSDDKLQLVDILVPSKFSVLIKAAKSITQYCVLSTRYRNQTKPSFPFQLGGFIKSAVSAALSLEIKKEDCRKVIVEQLQTMFLLVEKDWAQEISTEAPQDLTLNGFNKYSLIPAAENIKKFEEYLKNLISDAKVRLLENPTNYMAYCKLMEGLFCSIMLFNRRGVKEIQPIMLQIYKNYDSILLSALKNVLTEIEKILFSRMKTVMIRSSNGMVPVLIDELTAQSIDFLIEHRHQFGLDSNMYLFGLPKTNITINGHTILRQHAKIALGDENQAFLVTCMRLRKHLGTIAQIFRMDKNDLEQLSEFLEITDSEWYQLPDDVYQTAKISKLLMLYEQTELEGLDDYLVEDFTYLTEEKYSTPYNVKKVSKQTLLSPKSTKQTILAGVYSKKNTKNDSNTNPKKGRITKLIDKNSKIFKNTSDRIEDYLGEYRKNENLEYLYSSTENKEEAIKTTEEEINGYFVKEEVKTTYFTDILSTLTTEKEYALHGVKEEKMDITEENFALHRVKEEEFDLHRVKDEEFDLHRVKEEEST